MRFQTTKRIQGQDPELVLGVLEECLRSLSPEIVRQGSQITMLGLGPSPRAINRRDTTVIDVKREDGATILHADVRFQASAFLGTAAQDLVVQEKLDRVFDDLVTQLGMKSSQNKPYEPASTTEPLTAEPEAFAQQKPTGHPIDEPPVVTTAVAEEMIPAEAFSRAVNETPAHSITEPSAIEEPALTAEAETFAVSSEVEPQTSVEEPVEHEEAPAIAAGEAALSASAATNGTADPVTSPVEALDRQEVPRPDETVAAPKDVKISDGREAVDAANDQENSTAAKVEIAETVLNPAEAKISPLADLTKPETTPLIAGPEVVPARTEAAPEPATATPLPSAEVEKPISASATKIEGLAKSGTDAVKKPETVASISKPGAPPPSALKAPTVPSDSSPAKALKPKFSNITAPTKTSSVPAADFVGKGMFGVSGLDEEPEKSSKLLRWSAWVAALIVLVIAPLIWLYLPSHPESAAAPVNQPAASAAPPEPVTAPKEPGEDPDPAVVVDDWAAAMNSRDAAAQAAFYANPVERYFLRRNLSRNEVRADKQAAIDRRRGDWSVKMESVKVSRADGKTARVRLIKHYTVKEDGKIASEWFVPSVLQMTNAKGRWQITSERDLGWATSLDELGY